MKIAILYATAGHGHKMAAKYLFDLFEERKKTHPDLDVTQFDFLDYTPRHFQITYPGTYQLLVTYLSPAWAFFFWLLDQKWFNPIMRPLRRLFNKINSLRLEKKIIEMQPDVVIGVHFFVPEMIGALKRRGVFDGKMVTVVTDFFPHATWINQGTDHLVVMTDESEKVLEGWNVPGHKIKVFGIPVHEKFQAKDQKEEQRVALGLEKDKFTVLMTSGSFGIGPTEEIVQYLKQFEDRIQVIVVSGTNEGLKERLSQNTPDFLTVLGFVSNMDELMEASDLIIAKTGGLTTCESLAKKVPLVISKPIPGQEAGNAKFLLENDCAYYLDQPESIVAIVSSILEKEEGKAEYHQKIENITRVRKPNSTADIVDFVLTLDKQ